jgi:MFS transporter, PHS family, inorganic phosphate transporter
MSSSLLLSGIGFFTDAYDLFIIGQVTPMIGLLYFNGSLPIQYDLAMKGAALAGTLLGQLGFGLMGDYFGLTRSYMFTLTIMLFSTLGQAFASNLVSGLNIAAVITIWRFLLGLGIGGEYPLSATLTAETSTDANRGRRVATVFAMQGVGILCAAIASLVTVRAFKDQIEHNPKKLDAVWRILIGIGMVPTALTMLLRSGVPEPPREPKSFTGINKRVLFGTCATWFLLDVAFYSQNLFIPDMLADIGYSPKAKMSQPLTVYKKVYKNALGNIYISLLGTFPGYFFTVGLIEKLGRLRIQYMGFAVMTTTLALIAGLYHRLLQEQWAFLLLYGITFFFANFGPNSTTFILPAEVFPSCHRSTCHGISAASGKAGAILGLYMAGNVSKHYGNPVATAILSGFMFLGMLCTYFVPEPSRQAPQVAPLEFVAI